MCIVCIVYCIVYCICGRLVVCFKQYFRFCQQTIKYALFYIVLPRIWIEKTKKNSSHAWDWHVFYTFALLFSVSFNATFIVKFYLLKRRERITKNTAICIVWWFCFFPFDDIKRNISPEGFGINTFVLNNDETSFPNRKHKIILDFVLTLTHWVIEHINFLHLLYTKKKLLFQDLNLFPFFIQSSFV